MIEAAKQQPEIPAELRPVAVTWRAALDNYEPTREFAYGTATEYDGRNDTGRCFRIEAGAETLRDLERSLVVIDDGASARPYYVAGWQAGNPSPAHPEGCAPSVLLHPFPTNPEGRTRPDTGRVIDYGTWMLGPRRCYHLKVTREEQS